MEILSFLKAALHIQRVKRVGAATKKEHAQLMNFSGQSDRKRPIFGRFGSRNKFNSHRGRLRALPRESILFAPPALQRWIWGAALRSITDG